MRNQLTADEVNAATLGIDAGQIIEVGRRMAPSSWAHLTNRLFKLPLEEARADGHRVFVANGLKMEVDTCVDFLQLIVGPTKLGKPIRCWLKRGNAWSRISVKQREITQIRSEYFA